MISNQNHLGSISWCIVTGEYDDTQSRADEGDKFNCTVYVVMYVGM